MKFLGGWTEESKPGGLYGARTRTLEELERQVCLRRLPTLSLEGQRVPTACSRGANAQMELEVPEVP